MSEDCYHELTEHVEGFTRCVLCGKIWEYLEDIEEEVQLE